MVQKNQYVEMLIHGRGKQLGVPVRQLSRPKRRKTDRGLRGTSQRDGKAAECIGLVNKAVAADKLESATRETANITAGIPAPAIQLSKRTKRDGLNFDFNAFG
jgi:enoyl-CoA hydratase/carnithine racemase